MSIAIFLTRGGGFVDRNLKWLLFSVCLFIESPLLYAVVKENSEPIVTLNGDVSGITPDVPPIVPISDGGGHQSDVSFFDCSNFNPDQLESYYRNRSSDQVLNRVSLILPENEEFEGSQSHLRGLGRAITIYEDPAGDLSRVYTVNEIEVSGEDHASNGLRVVDLAAEAISNCARCVLKWNFASGKRYCSIDPIWYFNNDGTSTKIGNAMDGNELHESNTFSKSSRFEANAYSLNRLGGCQVSSSSFGFSFWILILLAFGGCLWRLRRSQS